jgi:hypothetical protein
MAAADLQNISDTVNALVRDGEENASPEQVAAAAQAYAAAAREINLRLQRCDQYLARGLRAEAVQLAECPPNILHAASALRVADPPAWERLCARHGQPRPAHPRTEVLARLATAIQENHRLLPLLDQLRVLTLARAPSAQRIDLLRRLRAADAQNPIWSEQLRLLEPSWHEKLRQEAETAIATAVRDSSGAERQLTALLAALDAPDWTIPPDSGWLAALRQRRDELRRTAALAELPCDELADALEAHDYDRCTRVLARWQAVLARHPQLTLPEALQRQVRQASAWLAGETRRRTINERMRAASATAPQSPASEAPSSSTASRAADVVRRIFRPNDQ